MAVKNLDACLFLITEKVESTKSRMGTYSTMLSEKTI